MTEILTRLREFDYIHMTVFEEEVILKVGGQINNHADLKSSIFFFLKLKFLEFYLMLLHGNSLK